MDIANIALDIAFTDLFLYLLLFSSLYIEFLTTKVFNNYMRYQIHFLLRLKLQKYLTILGYDPKKALDQLVCSIFYF